MDYHDTWNAIIGELTPAKAVACFELDPTVRTDIERWVVGCVDAARLHGLEADEDDLAMWVDHAVDELCSAFVVDAGEAPSHSGC